MVLGSYVDDAFGGAQRSKVAQAFVDFISGAGARLGAVINAKKNGRSCGVPCDIRLIV